MPDCLSADFAKRLLRSAAGAAVLALGLQAPAQALTIVPTFDAGFDATAEATVRSVIAGYEAAFTDNITVYIQFANMSSGLGQSSTFYYGGTYTNYLSKLAADATSANDSTALAHLPGGTTPVPTGTSLLATRAAWGAVGVNIAAPSGGVDSTVSLNLSLMNFTRSSIDPSKYDLQAVAQHEINEVLGTSSGLGWGGGQYTPMDLYRYTATGSRTFTTSGDNAYFSINGSTLLAQFNQSAGADYGDFKTSGLVQSAFGTPGTTPNMGVELTMLDVVGYNLASPVPEPTTLALMLAGLGWIGFASNRRKRPR
jgi:hypothetical protein